MNLPPIKLDVKPGGCKPKRGATVLKLRDRKYDECKHNSVVIDDRARTLECEECKAVLDPIQFLSEWAWRQRRIENMYEQYQRAIRRHEEIEREKARRKAIRQGHTVKDDVAYKARDGKTWHLTREVKRRGGRRRMIYSLCGTGLNFDSYAIETVDHLPEIGVCEKCAERAKGAKSA